MGRRVNLRAFAPFKPILAAVSVKGILFFGGIGAMAYGLSAIYAPAGWLFAGVALIWLAIR